MVYMLFPPCLFKNRFCFIGMSDQINHDIWLATFEKLFSSLALFCLRKNSGLVANKVNKESSPKGFWFTNFTNTD